MEKKKHLTTLVVLLALSFFTLSAQYKQDIYNAYINSNKKAWKATIDAMEKNEDKSNSFLLELINYQYGYIGFCLENNNKSEVKTHLKLAQNNLEKLEKTSRYPSYVNAYKSAFFGFSIVLNKLKAPFVGPKSITAAEQSIQQNPNNPFGFIQYANAQFYMPPVFGGSKDEAIKYYKQAQTIMERDSMEIKNDWNYLNLLTNIAQSYTKIKEFDQANKYYQLILTIEPNFLWVKNELYPTFIKDRNNETK